MSTRQWWVSSTGEISRLRIFRLSSQIVKSTSSSLDRNNSRGRNACKAQSFAHHLRYRSSDTLIRTQGVLTRRSRTNLLCFGRWLRGALCEPFHHKINNRAGGECPRAPAQGNRIAVAQSVNHNASHHHWQSDDVSQTQAAAGDAEGAGKVGALVAQSPGGEYGHHGGRGAQPDVDADQLAECVQCQRCVDGSRNQDRDPRSPIARVFSGEKGRQVSVFGERKGHAGGGEDSAVEQRHGADHGGGRHQIPEPGTADEMRRGREVSIFPLLPVAEGGQGGECRQEISRDGERNDQRERTRIGALRILDFLSDGRELFVSRIKPDSQSEANAKHRGKRLVWWYERHERVVVPLRQAENDHGDHGDEDKDFEGGGGFADHLNAANVNPCDEGNQGKRNQPVFPSGDLWEIESQVVGKEHGIGAAQ